MRAGGSTHTSSSSSHPGCAVSSLEQGWSKHPVCNHFLSTRNSGTSSPKAAQPRWAAGGRAAAAPPQSRCKSRALRTTGILVFSPQAAATTPCRHMQNSLLAPVSSLGNTSEGRCLPELPGLRSDATAKKRSHGAGLCAARQGRTSCTLRNRFGQRVCRQRKEPTLTTAQTSIPHFQHCYLTKQKGAFSLLPLVKQHEDVCMQKPHNLSLSIIFSMSRIKFKLKFESESPLKLKGFAGELDSPHGSS